MNYKGFHHLTWNDRLTIEKMLKVHTAKAKIAEALGVSVRTIYYEIKRGMCTQRNTDYTVEERYCAEVAERAYREHLKAPFTTTFTVGMCFWNLLRSTCMKRANGTIPNNAAKKPRERQKVKASNTARTKSSSAPLLEIGRWTA